MKFFVLCSALTLCLGLLLSSQSSLAQSATATTTPQATAIDEDDMIPDLNASATYEYHCELKDFLTIYANGDDNNHIALRWKNHLYRLHRIVTTTGANRFENTKVGLVWIGIPTKGMLLDSRHGQQLANECKTQAQETH